MTAGTLAACRRCRTVLVPGAGVCLVCRTVVLDAAAAAPPAAASQQLAADVPPPLLSVTSQHGPATPPDDVHVPPPSRRSVVLTQVLIGLAVLLVGGLLVARAVLFGPEDTVRDHLEALQDRDADAALAVVDWPEDVRGGALLRAAAVEDAGYTPPRDVELGRVEHIDDGLAVVTVDFVAHDDEPVSVEMAVQRAAGGVLPRWEVLSVHELEFSWAYGPRLLVAGQDVAVVDGRAAAYAFLGSYGASVPEDPYVVAEEVTAVAGPEAGTVEVAASMRTELTEEVDRRVQELLSTCASFDELAVEGCPFTASSWSSVTDVSWTIEQWPSYHYWYDDGVWSLRTTVEGIASVTGTEEGGWFSGPSTYSDSVSFDVDATITVNAGEVTLLPRSE